MAKQLSPGSDKALRGAALGVMEVVYELEGADNFWRHLPRVSDQQRSMIEERIKYVQRTLEAAARESGHHDVDMNNTKGPDDVDMSALSGDGAVPMDVDDVGYHPGRAP